MLRLSRFLRSLPSACAVLAAGAAALTSGQTAFAKTSMFGASSSSHVRERIEHHPTDGFVQVGIPPLSATEQKQLKGGFTNLLGTTTPAKSGWKLAALTDPVTFRFTPADYTVTESGVRLAITVERTGNTQSRASVQYQVGTQSGAGFATLNSDYTGGTGVLTFDTDVRTQSFTIGIVQDNAAPVVEPDELLYINLLNPKALDDTARGGVALSSTNSQATVQIYDDDSTISFSNPTYTTVEGTKTANLTLTRSGGEGVGSKIVALRNAATFTYTTADGPAGVTGAKSPADYTGRTAAQATFAAGSDTATLSIPVEDDRFDESDETFSVSIANPSPATNTLLGTQTTAQVTITDDDDTTVSLDASSYRVSEGGGSIAIRVTRLGNNNDSSRPLTVDYSAFSSGSGTTIATAGVDYISVRGTIEFKENETEMTITVPILQDTEAENDETFFVALDNVVVDGNKAPQVTGSVSPIQTATVTIEEDDPSFNLQPTPSSFNESSPTASVVVTRNTGVNTAASVSYRTADTISTVNRATADRDYTSTTGTLDFVAGQRTATIDIPLIEDTLDEADERFRVILFNPTGGFQIGPQGTLNVTIVDNDPTPIITVEDVSEREGNLVDGATKQRFVVRLKTTSGASIISGRPISVDYKTADGTATVADNDYTSTQGTLNIASETDTSKGTAYIDVPIIDDKKFESDEGYVLILSNPVNATLARTRITGTIRNLTTAKDGVNDDDPPVSIFDFASTSITVNETKPRTTASLVIRRTGDTTAAASVTLSTADGTALSGADYTAINNTVVSFPANVQTQTVAVTILDDEVNEPNETFTANLSNPTGTNSSAKLSDTYAPATVTIVDNDPIPNITVDNTSVVEGDSGTTRLVFNVRLSTLSDQTVTVNYSTADGTANVGSDYLEAKGTLTFAPRVTSQTVVVTILTDTDTEPNETLFLNLDTAQNATLGTTQATGTIVNDDTPLVIGALAFSENSKTPTVGEKAGEVVLTVTRSQGEDRRATVDYTTSDGTATAGNDYARTTGTLVFLVNERTATIRVPIIDDKLKESDTENFTVTLSNPSNNVTLPADPTATVTITDDEGTPTLSIADTQVVEGNSGRTSLLFTVTLLPQSQETVTVQAVTVTGGEEAEGKASSVATSSSPQDFRPNRATLTFAPGESTKTFPVTVLSDTLVEPDETLSVELYNASGALLSDSGSRASGTIVNDDVPGGGGTISFLASTYSVNESAGVATISLGRSGNVDMLNQQSASVQVTSGQGTATNGQDYRSIDSRITFAPGETVKSFTVPIINDTAYEQNETVPLTLSKPSDNAILGSVAQTTLTIRDDDPISVVPRADSLSPNNPSTRTFTVTSTYSSDRGLNGLSSVLIQIAGDARGGGFRAIYTPSTNVLLLDTGGQTGTPGSNRVLTGKYGSLDCSKTTVVRSGGTLRVTWTITLSFVNSQPIFVGASAPEGDSVFIRRGTWTAPAAKTNSSANGS